MKHLLFVLLALVLVAASSNINHQLKVVKTEKVEEFNDTTYHCGYLDTVVVSYYVPKVNKKLKRINHDSLEWYLYPEYENDLPVQNWTKKEKIVFANVISRESGSLRKGYKPKIDQYFVAIGIVRRMLDTGCDKVVYKKYNKEKFPWKKKVATDSTDTYYVVPMFCGTVRMEADTIPTFLDKRNPEMNRKAWQNCYQIVENVLSNNIPDFVPYIPPGTHFWIREEHCTDGGWVKKLKNRKDLFIKVGHTVKGHQFYAYRKYADLDDFSTRKRKEAELLAQEIPLL